MTNVPPKWRGRARIGDGYALFVGTAGDNEAHAHHAIQLAVATAGTFGLWRPRLGHHIARAALIAIDEPHLLAPCAAPVALLYVEGESAAGRALNGIAAISRARFAITSAWRPPSLCPVCALALQHANIDYTVGPLRHVLGVAETHRWHHKREYEDAQVNFGEFWIVFDRILGTYHSGPVPVCADAVGLSDEMLPRGWLAQFLWPFRRGG